MSVYVYNDISAKAASSANKCNELSNQWNCSGVEDNKTLDNCTQEIVLHTCFVMYCIHYHIVLYCIALQSVWVSTWFRSFMHVLCGFFVCACLSEYLIWIVYACVCVCMCVCAGGREGASERAGEVRREQMGAYLHILTSAPALGFVGVMSINIYDRLLTNR